MDWGDQLKQILGEDAVLTSGSALRAYDCDAYTIDRSAPTVVVLPSTTEQVSQVVKLCNEGKIPFTPRGAGTGLSGGAMPALGGVVISTKRLNSILEIDIPLKRMRVQSGVTNKRCSDAVAEHQLHFAPDPSSQSVSTIGGNIAENSGGPHTLKYGVTMNHVLGVTLVLPNGEIGEFTRGPGFDFLSLIVGSEGMLGIVTEAWLRLTPVPQETFTALCSFSSVRHACETVSKIIESGVLPAALEMMDKNILGALKAAFGLEYHAEAEALLLIELDGDPEEVRIESEQLMPLLHEALEVNVAQDSEERAKLWVARKKGIGAMGRLAPTIVTHDGVIPRSKLPEMLEFVYAEAAAAGIGVANLFHAGDGNLHPCFYFDDRDPVQVEKVVATGEKIIQKCVELGGSVSGEHGIGVEKADLLRLMFSDADLAVQAKVRQIFGWTELSNPCKVIPNQKGCTEHVRRWRGVAT